MMPITIRGIFYRDEMLSVSGNEKFGFLWQFIRKGNGILVRDLQVMEVYNKKEGF